MNRADRYIPVILAVLGVAAAPHFLHLPFWLTAVCLSMGGYMLSAWHGWLPWPGRTARRLITVLSLVLVAAGWGLAFNREAATALFVIMATLKPLEIDSHRDRMVSLFMGYLLVLTALFFTTSLAMGFYMVAAVAAVTAGLVHIHHPAGAGGQHLRLACLLTVQALPVMAILFVAFPRIQGSLWSFSSRPTARTGFSDTLSLGEISQLVTDSSIAFHADFETALPARQARYWRGVVLTVFDGRTWRRGRTRLAGAPLPEDRGNMALAYTITLEPHGQRWLFALDRPLAAPPRVALLEDLTLRTLRPVSETLRYRVTSLTGQSVGSAKGWTDEDLAVDPDTNPRAADLARRMAAANGPEAVVARTLAFFRDQGFVYSLTAPPPSDRPLDAFLFDTRRGYCEHYAAALAFLLRVAGVPARVVVGYQGGEVNPLSGDLVVRQSDAHAWTEAWLPVKGWTRLDATAVVAPVRLTAGAAGSLPAGEFAVDGGLLADLGRRLGYGWDAVNGVWHRWVTGYSFERQQGLLARLGLAGKTTIGLMAVAAGAAVIVMATIWLYARLPRLVRPKPKDRIEVVYRLFLRSAARVGLYKAPHQGPTDFAAMAGRKRPDLRGPIEGITDLYVRLRYSPRGTAADLDRLGRSVARFRPGKRVCVHAGEDPLGQG